MKPTTFSLTKEQEIEFNRLVALGDHFLNVSKHPKLAAEKYITASFVYPVEHPIRRDLSQKWFQLMEYGKLI
jgi:hypothetical protein